MTNSDNPASPEMCDETGCARIGGKDIDITEETKTGRCLKHFHQYRGLFTCDEEIAQSKFRD